MRIFTETRGQYTVNCYEVDVTPIMKKLALDFSTSLIQGDNQYNRLLPQQVTNIDVQTQLRIQRTYVGKVAELAFAELLIEMEKHFSTAGMFQIYEGQENVDDYDFVDSNGNLIDVKSGFRTIHHLLAVNTEQFDSPHHKDCYVAVKLNAIDVDPENKLVDLDSITTAQILGYKDYDNMRQHADIRDLGEGPARIVDYARLMGIDFLLRQFD